MLLASLIRNQVRDLNERVAVSGVDAGKDGIAANTEPLNVSLRRAFLVCRGVGRLALLSFECRANRLGFATKGKYQKILKTK